MGQTTINIDKQMNRAVTLKGLISFIGALFLVCVPLYKSHEDNQDKISLENAKKLIEHEERVLILEEFKEDIKEYKKAQNDNHKETMEAIGGMNTNISVLVERIHQLHSSDK